MKQGHRGDDRGWLEGGRDPKSKDFLLFNKDYHIKFEDSGSKRTLVTERRPISYLRSL